MTHPPPMPAMHRAAQWATLVALSAAIATLLTWLDLPAALLLGPMIGGMVLAFRGLRLDMPGPAFGFAQGVLGCMIAHTLPASLSGGSTGWPLLAAGALAVVAASALLSWVLARTRILPGSTVVWGLSPGAASVMTLMAGHFGADMQLVAFMQYLRVILVVTLASVVARLLGASAAPAAQAASWFAPIAWLPFLSTMALAASGPLLADRLRLRTGALLIPLIAGGVLVHAGWLTIELPHWLLAASYACIGWQIGLRFSRPLLLHALRALPGIIACTLALIAICGALAAGFVLFAGIDPLTAYLATSPGGADSVAIIAASSHADTGFVMTMQMVRFFAVLLAGPAIARFIATHTGTPSAPMPPPP